MGRVESEGHEAHVCFRNPVQPAFGKWDVSRVTEMNGMFDSAGQFNQPLNKWDVSRVRNMHSMLSSAVQFDQPLGSWDVSRVQSMVNDVYGEAFQSTFAGGMYRK